MADYKRIFEIAIKLRSLFTTANQRRTSERLPNVKLIRTVVITLFNFMETLSQYLKLNFFIGTSVSSPINMFISVCKKEKLSS